MISKKIILLFFCGLVFIGCNSSVNEKKSDSNTIVLNSSNTNTTVVVKKNEGRLDFNQTKKPVLLYFSTTWCRPCKVESAYINTLYNKYKSNIKFASIILDKNLTKSQLQTFSNKNKITYPLLNSEDGFKIASFLDIKDIPHIKIYDKESNLYKDYTGLIAQEMLDKDISILLNK